LLVWLRGREHNGRGDNGVSEISSAVKHGGLT
jgi:hypothetical protein